MSATAAPESQLSSEVQTSLGENDSPSRATPEVQQHASQLSQNEAAELAARRAAEAKLLARLQGWKAIVIWYVLWSILAAISAISALSSGQAGPFFIGAVICALCATYACYLFNGGRRRVWFVVW
jgi:hypothetical protein